MTLLSWLRLVGDVWLVGTHPHWAASAAGDPLVIELEGSRWPGEPVQRYYESELEGWHEWAGAGCGAARRFHELVGSDTVKTRAAGQRLHRFLLRLDPYGQMQTDSAQVALGGGA